MNANTIKPTKSASAYWNGDFYLIETLSGRGLNGRDPEGKQHTLQPDASAKELGEAMIDALAHSRLLSIEEATSFFDLKQVKARHAAWVEDLIATHGYKTKSALFRRMEHCEIFIGAGDEEVVTIRPMRHEKLESWIGAKNEGVEDVVIHEHSAEAFGEALLLAFSRCP